MFRAGYKIPAGQGLICSFWSLHRDESLWENAEAFVPERWLDTDTRAAEQRQHAWKAFGALQAVKGHVEECRRRGRPEAAVVHAGT